MAITSALGFATFLSYLGYGYLDTWHGLGTLLMVPVYVFGLARTRRLVVSSVDIRKLVVNLLRPRDRLELGRLVIVIGAVGVVAAGLTILGIGMSHVFVPEDTHFIGLTRSEIDQISPRLVPLIAHDRAGFGGAVAVMGLTTLMSLVLGPLPGRCSRRSDSPGSSRSGLHSLSISRSVIRISGN